MKNRMVKLVAMTFVIALCAVISYAEFAAEVSGVTMTQVANTRIVNIGYNLANEAAIITLAIETNGVPIPDSAVRNLSGDVCKVVEAGLNKSIVWNAGADWPEHSVTDARARVTAWSTKAPPQVINEAVQM
jgi:hypothetical protein